MNTFYSAVKVLSNPCVGPFPRTNMSFTFLSIWIEEPISTLKFNKFWRNPPPWNEKLDLLSNPIPKPEYWYFSISAFFVKLTAPNKHFFSVGSLSLELEAPSS